MTFSIAKELNKSEPRFNYEIPENHTFAKPAELVEANGLDQVYKVMGMYVNTKGKFGDEPVIILDSCLLNAPNHALEAVQSIITNDNYTDLVNKGRVGIKFYTYSNKFGKQYGLQWVDL